MANQPSRDQQSRDMESKEHVDRERFLDVLRQWVTAIEQHQDLDVSVGGQRCKIPADAIDRGRMRLEYEVDKGEYEFELTLKWR